MDILQRREDFPKWPYSRIRRDGPLAGRTVALLGGGPSFTTEQAEYCEFRVPSVAVNNAYARAPWAVLLYFCDARWFEWHKDFEGFKQFRGQIATLENTPLLHKDGRIHFLRRGEPAGLSTEQDKLNHGSNSGYQALNLVVLAGAVRIILLGFDMGLSSDGRTHWHKGHPQGASPSVYDVMLKKFSTLPPLLQKLGVEVINASPGSRLTLFPFRPLAEIV